MNNRTGFTPDRPRWWQWLTVLSLDAPMVAILWQWLFSHCAGVRLECRYYAILGNTICLTYAMDRWLEGLRLTQAQILTQRHYFYHRHRIGIALIWILAACYTVWLALSELNPRDLAGGAMLLAVALTYLLSHQFVHRHARWRAPKELCVGILIAAGSVLFTLTKHPVAWTCLQWPTVTFAALCTCNCLLISRWELIVDRAQGQSSAATQSATNRSLIRILPWSLAILTSVMAISFASRICVIFLCEAGSCILMGLTDLFQPRFGRQFARVFVDVALMTPVIPLLLSACGLSLV